MTALMIFGAVAWVTLFVGFCHICFWASEAVVDTVDDLVTDAKELWL